jgi:PTH2 family peptidyl-tRNA hydrolase
MDSSENDASPRRTNESVQTEGELSSELQAMAIGPAVTTAATAQSSTLSGDNTPLLAIAANPYTSSTSTGNAPAFVQDINKWKPNDELLGHLLEMGFSIEQARKGMFHTNSESVQLAINWILTYGDSISDDQVETKVPNPIDNSELKMTFVVNGSLQMGVGKVAAQVAHAALSLNRTLHEKQDLYEFPLYIWNLNGSTKIVLRANSTDELMRLEEHAQRLSLPTALIRDAGRTQIPSGSITVLGLFGTHDTLQNVTGHLKLL